ncbi:MAG: thioredoxin family protein [Melioribacteraceae bacterium]|jgi:predicted thioredoxin/glutaredoxin|nr:thioredoxin family protein [Melioribacteraceae bacterium]
MNFDLVVAKKCSACERVERELQKYTALNDFINFEISIQNLSKHKTSIVPSLFINGKLFSYGDVDLKQLDKKVQKEIRILI